MFNPFGIPNMMEDAMAIIRNLSNEVISARVRMRALLEIMEEKGLLDPGEFDERAAAVWERDYDDLAKDLMVPSEPTLGFGTDEIIAQLQREMPALDDEAKPD